MLTLKPEKKTWAEVKALAANRTRWRNFTRTLCSTEEYKELMMMMNVNNFNVVTLTGIITDFLKVCFSG
jgi:hypothetical protein